MLFQLPVSFGRTLLVCDFFKRTLFCQSFQIYYHQAAPSLPCVFNVCESVVTHCLYFSLASASQPPCGSFLGGRAVCVTTVLCPILFLLVGCFLRQRLYL